MTEATEGKGSCLCGAVRVVARTMKRHMGACHCTMCRKWGGGPLLAVECGADVNFEGGENIAIFESSDWAQRGFCKVCGTHLFYKLKKPEQYALPAGLIETTDPLIFDHQIFIESKPDYYSFANETRNMTGAEVFAQFAPSGD